MKKSVVIPWEKYQKLIGDREEEDVEKSIPASYNQEKIISTIPPKMRSRAGALLGLLPETNISWNQRGELMIDKECVEGTNICDLVKSVLWDYKNYEPKGFEVFVNALATNNVPETLIQNTKCRSDAQRVKSKPKAWLSF